MRPIHYITIIVALAAIGVLYCLGNTTPPPKSGIAKSARGKQPHAAHDLSELSVDSLVNAASKELPAHAVEEIKLLEKRIAAVQDSSRMTVMFDTLAHLWQEHKQLPIAANYYLLAAKLENSEKKLTFAAQLFLDLARKANSESVQAWEGQSAIEGFSRALQINPGNDTAKINLAECYIGTGATMQGVLLLREVTEKDPDNVPANLILGQQGIVSGQLDKALARFEKILTKEPKNIEALLGSAEVYKNKGNITKAKELLEQSKRIMNNPEFSKDIDQYIKSF